MEKNTNNNELKAKWLKPLKLFGAYIFTLISVIASLDTVQSKINLSFNLILLAVYFFVALTPPLVSFYLFHQKEINRKVNKLWEQIVVALNVLFVTVVLFHGYSNPNIFTKKTENTAPINTPEGQERVSVVTENNFKSEIPIFRFRPEENIKRSSKNYWLGDGISGLLTEDLSQSTILNPVELYASDDREKVSRAIRYNTYFVDGEFEVRDSLYTITTFIKDSKFAKTRRQKVFKGTDVLALIDSMAIFVHKAFTPTTMKEAEYLDLPVKDLTSSSLKALEYYYDFGESSKKAIKEDSTFVLPYFELIRASDSTDKKGFLNKLKKYEHKLSQKRKKEFTILQYKVNKDYSSIQKLLGVLARDNPVIADELYIRYGRTKDVEAYIDKIYSIYNKNPKTEYRDNYIFASLLDGDYGRVDEMLKKLHLTDFSKKNVLFLHMCLEVSSGKADHLKEKLDTFKLQNPDWETTYKPFIAWIENAIQLKRQQISSKNLQKFKGTYNSSDRKKIREYLADNNKLIEYSDANGLQLLIMVDEDLFLKIAPESILQGFDKSDWLFVNRLKFIKDTTEQYFTIKESFGNILDNTDDDRSPSILWKKDKSLEKVIETAGSLLKARKLDSAKQVYTNAMATYPNHLFLKEALAHIEYIESMDSTALIQQYQILTGNYEKPKDGSYIVSSGLGKLKNMPDRIWKLGDRLLYKHWEIWLQKYSDTLELRPIAKNRYMTLENLEEQLVFHFEEGTFPEFKFEVFDPEKGKFIPKKDWFQKSIIFQKVDNKVQKITAWLQASNLDSAKYYCEKTIALYPKHHQRYFLDHLLKHIAYVQPKSSKALMQQYQTIVGSYGRDNPRKFWVADGKLKYERGEDISYELYPIAKNRYISLDRPTIQFVFEFGKDNSVTSVIYDYDIKEKRWKRTTYEGNILKKIL